MPTRSRVPPFPALVLATLAAALVTAPMPFPRTARADGPARAPALRLDPQGYFTAPGVDVMAFQDIYPEGHQGGVGIIQNGVRVATNGDLRLEPTPGQWAPVPKSEGPRRRPCRRRDRRDARYPDPAKDRKGFNPIDYPDLRLTYKVRVRAAGDRRPHRRWISTGRCRREWVGKVGFNLELYPAALFGRTFYVGNPANRHGPGSSRARPTARCASTRAARCSPCRSAPAAPDHRAGGPRPAAGDREPGRSRERGEPWSCSTGAANTPTAGSWCASLVPSGRGDGRDRVARHPARAARLASPPVVHVSQVGYHPRAAEDRGDGAGRRRRRGARPARGAGAGRRGRPARDGAFGAAARLGPVPPVPSTCDFDFTAVDGARRVRGRVSARRAAEPFRIAADVYERHVWQPDARVLPAHPDVPHARERAVPGLARGLPPRRRADGAGRPQPLRRLPQGPSTLSAVKPRGAGGRAWTSAAGTTPATTTCASSRRRARSTSLALAYEAFGLGLRRHDDRPGAARRRDPPARRQARHPAADRARAAGRRGRLPGAGPALPRHHRPDAAAVRDAGRHRQPDRQPRLRPGARAKASAPAARSGRPDDRWVFTEQNPRARSTAAATRRRRARERAPATYDRRRSPPEIASARLARGRCGTDRRRCRRRGFDARIAAAVELFLTHAQGRVPRAPRGQPRRRSSPASSTSAGSWPGPARDRGPPVRRGAPRGPCARQSRRTAEAQETPLRRALRAR